MPQAIRSLEAQTHAISRIVVVSDNSSDGTAELVRSWGGNVELFETLGNRDKKAGALNQALSRFLPEIEGFVLVMDADSEVVPEFVTAALAAFEPSVGAVGGIFLARQADGLLQQLQLNEYTRYAREIARRRARAKVLTGTATILPVSILREVEVARREGRLPGGSGGRSVLYREYYNTDALTEDFELTLAISHLGYRCLSPKACVVYTELMPSPAALWKQRIRWQTGGTQCLRMYGVTRVTTPYIARQTFTMVGIVSLLLLVGVTLGSAFAGWLDFQPFWTTVGSVFLAERVVTVWRGGAKARLIALFTLPEFSYDAFISAVFVVSYAKFLIGRTCDWGVETIDKL